MRGWIVTAVIALSFMGLLVAFWLAYRGDFPAMWAIFDCHGCHV